MLNPNNQPLTHIYNRHDLVIDNRNDFNYIGPFNHIHRITNDLYDESNYRGIFLNLLFDYANNKGPAPENEDPESMGDDYYEKVFNCIDYEEIELCDAIYESDKQVDLVNGDSVILTLTEIQQPKLLNIAVQSILREFTQKLGYYRTKQFFNNFTFMTNIKLKGYTYKKTTKDGTPTYACNMHDLYLIQEWIFANLDTKDLQLLTKSILNLRNKNYWRNICFYNHRYNKKTYLQNYQNLVYYFKYHSKNDALPEKIFKFLNLIMNVDNKQRRRASEIITKKAFCPHNDLGKIMFNVRIKLAGLDDYYD